MSSRPSAFDALRQAPGGVGASGNPTFEWRLTNTRLRDPVRIVVQDRILPVIFVPGIMGSNLMDLGGAPVWRLDTGLGGVPWSLVRNVAPMGPGRRQRAMHPDRTQVDPNGRVPHDAVGTINGRTRRDREAIYRERFWGEIGDSTYHPYLQWLENQLNGQGLDPARWASFTYAHPMMSAAPAPGQPPQTPALLEGQEMVVRGMACGTNERPMDALTSDELLRRAAARMPVYACGYNWLASNNSAARELRDRIKHVIAVESRRGRCEQVLLVTHSMGGLVARRCAGLPGMEGLIAGVVHGVMPAVGAAVAYRRCKVGMRDESFAAGLVIGSNGREVTAVFAQAPGALQLLPTRQYRRGWLRFKDPQGRELEPVPAADPYDEIYLRRDRWWALVREDWLRPPGGMPISWNHFEENVLEASVFHDAIQGAYHPNTYVYYGADNAVPSFETVSWSMTPGLGGGLGPPPDAQAVRGMGPGEVRDSGRNPAYVGGQLEVIPGPGMGFAGTYQSSHWELSADAQDGGGDGTVPSSSGSSPMRHSSQPGSIRQQFRLTGFEHEPSYNDEGARLVTLYCIQKISAEAMAAT